MAATSKPLARAVPEQVDALRRKISDAVNSGGRVRVHKSLLSSSARECLDRGTVRDFALIEGLLRHDLLFSDETKAFLKSLTRNDADFKFFSKQFKVRKPAWLLRRARNAFPRLFAPRGVEFERSVPAGKPPENLYDTSGLRLREPTQPTLREEKR